MEVILKLIMDHLDTVIEWAVLGIMFIVFKGRKPSATIIENAKGVGVAIQELVLSIMAEIAQDHEKVNNKLLNKVNLAVIPDIDMQRHEVAKQALVELKDTKLDKIAKKVGGYDNLIRIVYKSGKWLLKALKKGK